MGKQVIAIMVGCITTVHTCGLISGLILAADTQTAKVDGREHVVSRSDTLRHPIRAGTYINGDWKYVLKIRLEDTKSESRDGSLFYRDAIVMGRYSGDTLTTPFGKMAFVSVPYCIGWMTEVGSGRRIFLDNGDWDLDLSLRYNLRQCMDISPPVVPSPSTLDSAQFGNVYVHVKGARLCSDIRNQLLNHNPKNNVFPLVSTYYFREYYRKGKGKPGLILYVKFGIMSSGTVCCTEVLKTTITDTLFVGELVSIIKGINFGPISTPNDTSIFCVPFRF
jgi:hypothetical protein